MRVLEVCVCFLLVSVAVGAQPLPMGVPDLCAGRSPIIAAGTSVTYTGAVQETCIGVHGTLVISSGTTLTVQTLLVYPGGTLRVGTLAQPAVNVEIIIRDAPIDTAADPEQFGHGLVCFGTCHLYGQPVTPTFVRLASAPSAGATTLQMESQVSWRPGDRLVVPESIQRADPIWMNLQAWQPQWETPTVQAVTGSLVRLTAPLAYSHPGASSSFLPHVGNLSRSVVIRSANPDGVRGHVIAIHRADVDIRHVAFKDMGRTTTDPLDSSDDLRVGTNQIGRYALHLHHVFGPEQPTSERQFRLVGNAVDGSPKWGIVIHNTSFGLIHDNVVYDAAGAAFMFEDGQEAYNDVVHNFAVRSFGTGGRQGEGREGGGFWFRGPLNRVRDNVAANIFSDGPDASYGYKFFFTYLGTLRVPLKPGADTTQPGTYLEMNGNATAVVEFRDNEVYAGESGLTFWWIGTFGANLPNLSTPRSTLDGLRSWHLFGRGIFQYENYNVTVKDFVALNTGPNYAHGYTGGDYFAQAFRLENPRVEGFQTGLFPSWVTGGGPLEVIGGRLRNMVDVDVENLATSSYRADGLLPTELVIDGTRFDGQQAIRMRYQDVPTRHLVQRQAVTVRNYNGQQGDDFRVFYQEQAPSFIVPQTVLNPDGSPSLLGAPVAGLTNVQAFAKYGIAIAGAVAPCVNMRPGITGFACADGDAEIQTPPPTSLRIISLTD